MTAPAFAQNDALHGTWSGQWIPESGYDEVLSKVVDREF